jgi:hypothetical protein
VRAWEGYRGLAVSDGTYRNGLPHPSKPLRWRIACELIVIILLTVLVMNFFPPRTIGVQVGMALIALGLIGFTAAETKERIWGPPASPPFDRIRRCFVNMSLLTIPPVLVFLAYGALARQMRWKLWWGGEPAAMFGSHFFIALCLYLPWALLQQTLFQFYLLGRLRALLPFATPWTLSIINGIAYGLMHWPTLPVVGVTIIGGILWSYSYHRDRYVLPIAISHALLGSTFYYWVYGRDLVGEFLKAW